MEVDTIDAQRVTCRFLMSYLETSRLLVGTSAAVREIEFEIQCAARSDAKVLVTGESGVGKEVVAKLIHKNSYRSHAPLITINCAGVPDSLLESELFGHVRGSFTDAYRDKRGWLEQAHGGTIFMDEVGEMSLRMQALLLRFLENGEIQRVGSERAHSRVDVRIIAATTRDLLARVKEQQFREDFYYRLNVVHIPVPPLRERREDIPLLLDHFTESYAERHQGKPVQISADAMARLLEHDWPGNIRELKNVVERIVVRSRSGIVGENELPHEIRRTVWPARESGADVRVKVVSDALYDRMTLGRESFWVVVHEPFMSHDITRQDLREIVSRGLEQTRGSYKTLTQLFNLDPGDYKRLLSFLRKYECHMPFQRFRTIPRPEPAVVPSVVNDRAMAR